MNQKGRDTKMPKKMLIERVGSLQLKESKGRARPGCLGTLVGPCADFKNPTRNSNFYSRKLWENSFNDPLIKESLEDRILIGELDHPGDRLETWATNACIVMTNYEFDDNNGVVIGTFDILDTPRGRILRSLLDYGCKIGVSSRGEGDVIDESDRSVVDEEGFELVAFDAVVLPAVKAAKPALQESYSRTSLKESLQKEVDNAQTTAELNLIKSVVETINLPDADSLLESVDHKSQELSSGTTGSEALLEDLEKATSQVQELTEEVDRLKSDLTTCKSKYYSQIGNRQKVVNESMTQRGKVKDLESKYKASVFKSSALSGKVKDLELKYKASVLESTTQRDKVRDLESRCEALVLESASSSRKVDRLQESVNHQRSTISQLRSELNESQKRTKEAESCIKRLQESLNESQKFGRSKLDEVSQLMKEIEMLEDDRDRSLQESADRSHTVIANLESQLAKVKSAYSQTLNAFISAKCKAEGVSTSEIRESLTKTPGRKDLETINKLIESKADEAARYKAMPVINDGLVNLLEGTTTVKFSSGQLREDEEMAQTRSFMDEANKLF